MTRKTPLLPLAVFASMLLFALVAAGCGEKAEPTTPEDVRPDKINLMLDWLPNANHAGIYTAIADGAFKERALVVKPQVPPEGAGVIQQVEAERVDLGITYPSYLLQARDKGAEVTAVAAIVNVPLNSLIWLKKSGIKEIKDLEGKTVAVSGDDNSMELDTILKGNSVDPSTVKQVNVGFDLQKILISGRADASITGYWNVEGVQLKQEGLKPTVTPVDDAGSPTYNELVVVVKTSRLKDGRRAEVIRRFIAGLQEGTANAVADPKSALAALAAEAPELTKTPADRKFNAASLRVTLPILAQKNIGDNPFGWLDPTIWENYGKWMRENGALTNSNADYTDAITNELLPGMVPGADKPKKQPGGIQVD